MEKIIIHLNLILGLFLLLQNSLGAQDLKTLKDLEEEIKSLKPGNTHFLITGYGSGSFTNTTKADSTFAGVFNPIFLWRLSDFLFFEGEMELELENGATTTAIEYAEGFVTVNDYLSLGVGKFLSPFGIFRERLHPKWINKLPDAPLGYASGANLLAPKGQIGLQIRGALPTLGDSKVVYALWGANGPMVQTGAANAGQLSFENTDDNNENKALGGRIGFLPWSSLELGYSLQGSSVQQRGTTPSGVDEAFLHEVDVSYHSLNFLKGEVAFHSEWILSRIDEGDYGTAGGAFENDRQAGYLQLAYKPTFFKSFLKKFEPVVRFDFIDHPTNAPTNNDEKRATVGLNYYVSPAMVFKAAYRFDEQKNNATEADAVLLRASMAF